MTAAPDRPAPRGALAGAAFLMATSAIGPGFLTQTAVFTERQRGAFAFAIVLSLVLSLVAQANVWRVLVAAGRRGPELASAVLPGLGPVLTVLVCAGGLVFNLGNVAGCGLGLAVFGVPERAGALASALVVALLLASPRAGQAMDRAARLLGALMIVLTAGVMLASRPDYAAAARGAVVPQRVDVLSVLTLLGGTVGGYIPYAGAHRLLDAGVSGVGSVGRASRSAALGVAVTAAMRVLFFLAVLGVLGHAGALDPGNPPASAFRQGAGEWGYRVFGVVLWSAAVTSVIGCTYTSLSFAESLLPWLRAHRPAAIGVFVSASLAGFMLLGRPVQLLVLAGALNGMILPATLLAVLLAAGRPDLLGGYRHPRALAAAGWIALAAAIAAGLVSLADLGGLWHVQ